MARVPAILRPLGGPLAANPNRSAISGRYAAPERTVPATEALAQAAALAGLVFLGFALAALVFFAVRGAATISARGAVNALVNSGVLALLTTAASVVLAGVLVFGMTTGTNAWQRFMQRSVRLAAGVPLVVPAVAGFVLVSYADSPATAMIWIVLAQAAVLAPLAATSLFNALQTVGRASDAAAAGLGASPRQRFSVLFAPALSTALPRTMLAVFGVALADLAAPTLLGPDLPTLPGMLWRLAISGDIPGAAVFAVLLATIGVVPGASLIRQLNPASGTARAAFPAALPIAEGMLTGAMKSAAAVLLLPVAIAPFVLLVASLRGAAPGMLLAALPVVLGGSLIGALLALGLAMVLRSLGQPGRVLGRVIPLLPGPAVGLAVIAAYSGLLQQLPASGLMFMTALALGSGLAAALQFVPGRTLLPRASREAADDLGGHRLELTISLAGRPTLAMLLRSVAATLTAGGVAFIAVIGLAHPLAVALNAEIASGKSTAAAAALTLLALVAALHAAAGYLDSLNSRTVGDDYAGH